MRKVVVGEIRKVVVVGEKRKVVVGEMRKVVVVG